MNQKNKDKDELTHEEWERKAQHLINAKFDRDKQLSLEQSLAKRGIFRRPNDSKRVLLRRALAVAASFLILLVAGWYFFLRTGDPVQKLALQHIGSHHQLVDEVKRGAEGIAQNKGRALEAYYNEQYEVALQHLQAIEAEDLADADVYFLMGLCLMYQQSPNYGAALGAFSKARSMDPESYQDEINWYSALCYIMTDQPDAAKMALQKVADSPSSRKNKDAEKLLQTMTGDK